MKTILFLRGPAALRETLSLGFLGHDDAILNLYPFLDEGGACGWTTGLVNPERNTLLVEHPLPKQLRLPTLMAGLEVVEADLVVIQASGSAYKADCSLSEQLLRLGHRVVWAFIGPSQNMGRTHARFLGVEVNGETRRIETLDLSTKRAWSELCQHLRIPA